MHAPASYVEPKTTRHRDFLNKGYMEIKKHYEEVLAKSRQYREFIKKQLIDAECKLDFKHVLLEILMIEAFRTTVEAGNQTQSEDIFKRWKHNFHTLLESQEKYTAILKSYQITEEEYLEPNCEEIKEIANEFERRFPEYVPVIYSHTTPGLLPRLIIDKKSLTEKLALTEAEKIIFGGEISLKEYIKKLDFKACIKGLKEFLDANIEHGQVEAGIVYDPIHDKTLNFDPLGVFKIYLNPRSAEAFIALNHELILQPNIKLKNLYPLFNEKIKQALEISKYQSEPEDPTVQARPVYVNDNSLYFTRAFVIEDLKLTISLLDREKHAAPPQQYASIDKFYRKTIIAKFYNY